eukprot:PITA_03354
MSVSPVHDTSLNLATGSAGVINLVNPAFNSLDALSTVDVAGRHGSPSGINKSYAKELAVASMNELTRMAGMHQPFWIKISHDGIKETLNHDEYFRQFPRANGPKPLGYVTEGSRGVGTVLMNSMDLVEILMNSKRYSEMFASIVSRATTLEVLSDGIEGTTNGKLQLMYMELHALSPLGPLREIYFLRFCQQLGAGVWAVVDVSADSLVENSIPVNCKRQPSGLIIQDLPGNCSNVTWVEHIDYDHRGVDYVFHSVVSSGLAFGSQRWLSALQHQCQRLALMEINADTAAFPDPRGRQSLLKLAQRMTSDFCASLSPSAVHNWAKLSDNGDEDIRVSTRKNMENPEFPGLVLCAATSVWLPVNHQKSFNFLQDLKRRSQWDMLSIGEPKQEITRIVMGEDGRNSVSLASNGINTSQTALTLQECCTGSSGSIIVYAPFDMASMHAVMHGGEPDHVSVLPCGFVILPDGLDIGSKFSTEHKGGTILTVAFQILLTNMATPRARATMEDLQAVQSLITSTVQKIRSALIVEVA